MAGKSETSTLFTYKCRIGLAGDFPVILRTIVQIFFIELRLLILDTKDCQDLRLVDFIVRLALARAMRKFSILAGVGDVLYFSSSFSSTTDGVHAFVIKPDGTEMIQYTYGDPPNGACRWSMKKIAIFDQYIALSRK